MNPMTNEEMRKCFADLSQKAPIKPPHDPTLVKDLRRGRPIVKDSLPIALIEDSSGMLRWECGPNARHAVVTGGSGQRRASVSGRNVIYSEDVPKLGSNQILEWLRNFDSFCNPALGQAPYRLREFKSTGAWADPAGPLPDPGPLLVFVHGTASSCDHICGEELPSTTPGDRLLFKARKHYKAVLAFDHPTISVSPFVNALDLAQALAPYGDRDIDIVCHSRGGLVASWWMHVIDTRTSRKRCVFVGSPLNGTSLANPAKMRPSMNHLAEYGKLLGNQNGLFALPKAILTVGASVVDLTARAPVLDAAFAMIPGLGAQSRTDNNSELQRLQRLQAAAANNHFYIRASFTSEDPGWKLWKYITDEPLLRAASKFTDRIIFQAQNDLVVDTESMQLAPTAPPDHVCTFEGPDQRVHHTNYFRQARTIDHIRTKLVIPD